MENVMGIIQKQAEDALQRLGIDGYVPAERVAQSILQQNVYWEQPLTGGDKLLFVRLFSPVIQREEVFLGNVLFNAFLSKAFARAVERAEIGDVELVANDLESYYFLIRTNLDIAKLVDVFSTEVERGLPDLFFSEPDEERGIYGDPETMLEFEKANVEPFPLFIMPLCYADRLEATVRQSLLRKIEQSSFDRNPTSIMANLAFFYSHEGTEMQSPYMFLARLALQYGIIRVDDLRQALLLDQDVDLNDENRVKKIIEDSFKQKGGSTFSPTRLRELLKQTVEALGREVDQDPISWRMPYVRSKFLTEDEKMLTAVLLETVAIGYVSFRNSVKTFDIGCRVCGAKPVALEDKSILMGQNTHKFHNQSARYGRNQDPKVCLRCATYTYLMVKLMGSEAVGQPQIPKTYNLIFHYGRHDNDEVENLTNRIDLILDLVRQHRDAERIRRDVNAEVKDIKGKLEQAKSEKTRLKWKQEHDEKEAELQQAQDKISAIGNQILQNYPWMKDIGTSPVPSENPSLDTLANIQLSESRVERHILGLGMGGYRMILFVLPQIRTPRGKEHDFAQRRFSNSRVTVSAMLSFLRQLCGCDGPFYYQSLPTITSDAFQSDTFYVRDEAISVEKAQKEYEAVTQLAWQLIWQRGSDGFVRKVILAEKLIEDPIGMFATVMRDSPILGRKEGTYKRLHVEYRQDWKTYDLTEYTKFIQKLSALQEVNSMALKIDREKLDIFCSELFRILDVVGLLPRPLSVKPNEFEKYPRLLFGSIQRYNDVEAGFGEWESRVLRKLDDYNPYRKEEHYTGLEKLRQWMVENKAVFTEKANMQHLRTSLYARVFNYLYPRRALANAYCAKEQGNADALSEEALAQRFPQVIETEVQKLRETYQDEWDAIVTDTRFSLLANKAYYEAVLRGKEDITTQAELQSSDSEAEKEEVQ